ncbi:MULTISPECIES: FliM/FliN family flagellar motor switch protein [unclassified Iodidimonas]|jgi:flagellar motor switch protein FliM|uniref:FliM/FliN family flagellar motor switch protein n=1 Tax=unclassified Iodidimonas TaxID=2626145 RepID=UPI0024828188|nr:MULTISPECIES: FliM/FliN family flagellar motor switch protein [unclassified Iodidimonas]
MANEPQTDDQQGTLGQAFAAAVDVDLSKNELDQSDIDRLMSDHATSFDTPETVMQKIANSTIVNYERLPMLDVVFDRFVRLFGEKLRQLMSANLEVSIDQVSAIRFGDFIEQVPLPCLVSILNAVEWEDKCVAVMDHRLVYTAVEILLGGREMLDSDTLEVRTLTSVERRLVTRLMTVFSGALSEAFTPVSDIAFNVDRLETNPQLAMIARSTSASIHARFAIEIENRHGFVDLVMPYSMLEPVRTLLLQMFMGESFGRDNGWKKHFRDQLQRTEIRLDGVLAEMEIPLATALGWKAGTFIELNKSADGSADLLSGDMRLLSGHIGQSKGQIAIKIEKNIFDASEEQNA